MFVVHDGNYDGGIYRCDPNWELIKALMGWAWMGLNAGLGDEMALSESTPEIGECGIIGGGCFTAGTPVQLSDGSTKPVEQVQTGDVVESRNEKSGKTEPEKVTATIKHYNVPTVTLTFSNGDEVVTTGVHPFYVQGRGFVPAGQLAIGNAIVTRAGPAVSITKIEQTTPETVYNITVDGDHTYFVGSKDGGVWVHNTDPLVCPSSSLIDPNRLDHILNGEFNKAGELTGGGHRFGTSLGKVVNKPGGAPHTEFPASWSDEDIADSIVNVATDPTSVAGAQVGKVGVPLTKAGKPARWSLTNTVNKVNVRVIWEPAGRGIVTAFPVK